MTILNNILSCAEDKIAKYSVFGINYTDHFTAHYDEFHTIFPNLANYSSVVGIIIAIAVVLMVTLGASKSLYKVRSSLLCWSFVIVWFYGFLVYDIGMCTGESISLWTNIPMAILYAFKIFLFDSDISEIHEAYHGSWAYSFNFALVHLLAAIVSTLFVIKYFGFNILAKWKMRKVSLFRKDVDESYVFWGFNDASEKLIESIQEQHTKGTYRIIIVRLNNEDDDNPETRTGIGRIFDFLSIPTSELEKLQNIKKCLTVGTYSNISNINVTKEEFDVLGELLSLRTLRRVLEKRTRNKIHMLFLGDNEKDNLHAVSLLLKDKSIKSFVNKSTLDNESDSKREVIFYCLARFNSVHRVIEDQSISTQIKVKVVDSSHINVEMLKENPKLLPVNYVNIEADATVSTPFNALVVGFSEVGQDSVRFLYEFGAFVKSGSTDNIAIRSEFHLDVVDKKMSDLAGVFVSNAPAIKPSMPFINNGENPNSLITLHQMDCRSVEFYQKLTGEWIQKLNYIVIATEDDELNISLGIRVFKAATRYRKDLKNFCILVRAHNDDDGHIRRIAQHYNLLWAAYEKTPSDSKGKRIHQDKIKKESALENPIICVFGLDKDTFTYENIIADKLEQKARKYVERYVATTEPNKKIEKSAYDDNFEDIMQLKGKYVGYYPTYFGMMLLRRTLSQDMANSLHEETKKILIQQALRRCNLENFVFAKLTRTPNTTKYIWPRGEEIIEQINRIAITIAQTEHLRWNASHEILGYIYDDEKDEVRCKHDCLKDWAALSESFRSFDCNVSDFILGIKFIHE